MSERSDTHFRFAPSPNGRLHLGHAYSALVTQHLAQVHGGTVHLRIEDIDQSRTREEFITAIIEDLTWIGFNWTGAVTRQSDNFSSYAQAANILSANGLLYPCYATRKEIIKAAGPDPARDPDGAVLYPGRSNVLSTDEQHKRAKTQMPHALRLDMTYALQLAEHALQGNSLTYSSFDDTSHTQIHACNPAAWGDVVIVRKDTPTSYHLAVVVDDAAQDITHITRGKDLQSATDIHRLLQTLLDLPEPLYHHHDLIMADDHRKLSKSENDTSLSDLRENGMTAAQVRERIGITAPAIGVD